MPPPPPRSSRNPSIPEPLDQVVLKAMAKDPALRYSSARDMVAALESLSRATVKPSAAPSPDVTTLLRRFPQALPMRSLNKLS